jgi:hypothetical protein
MNPVLDLDKTFDEMQDTVRQNKESAATGEEARRWAILNTELEKAYAYYNTYLKPVNQNVEGGS